jgi:hypothetical protein
MLDAAAEAHMQRNPGACLDTSGDFDVLLFRTLTPEQEVSIIEVPVRIHLDWSRLARLVR